MMPLTMKTAPTPEGRARIVHERLLTPSAELDDFDWFVGWVAEMLSRHGSTAQPPAVATRVFAWGLQHACTPEQWRRFKPIVEHSCPPAMWDELARNYGMAWGVGGWLLTPFLQKIGRPEQVRLRERVVKSLKTTFASHYTKTVSLTEALDLANIAVYGKRATGEKYLINPNKA